MEIDRRRAEPQRSGAVWFARSRRFSGSAARKLIKEMVGATGLVVEIRMPPLGMRAAQVDWSRWPIKSVQISHLKPIKVPSYTFDPVGVRLDPGYHHVSLLDDDGRPFAAKGIRVTRGAITVVTVFPPTGVSNARLVRSDLSIECAESRRPNERVPGLSRRRARSIQD